MKFTVHRWQLLAAGLAAVAALIGAALAIAAGAVASPGARSAPAASRAAAALPKCNRSQLTAWAAMPANGLAALTVYYEFEISNISRHACTLDGYPSVTALNDSGVQLGSAAGRYPRYLTRPVQIGPGGTAHYQLGITVGAWSTSVCRPTAAFALRVVAPGTHGGMQMPFSLTACAKRGPVYLIVTAVATNTGIPRYN